MSKLSWLGLSLLAAVVCLPGCGGDTQRPTVPVTGTITLNGKPVEGATVTFAPQNADDVAPEEKVLSAAGRTGADGTYTLNSAGGGTGAMPGSYKVAVVKVVEDAKAASNRPTSQADYEKMLKEKIAGGGQNALIEMGKSEVKAGLPAVYSNPESSGFVAEVTEGGTNQFDFDLKQ